MAHAVSALPPTTEKVKLSEIVLMRQISDHLRNLTLLGLRFLLAGEPACVSCEGFSPGTHVILSKINTLSLYM